MELALNMVIGLNCCFNARFMLLNLQLKMIAIYFIIRFLNSKGFPSP